MTDNNLLDSPETNKSLSTEKDTVDSNEEKPFFAQGIFSYCLLYTSPSPRDRQKSRMPSSA